MFSGNIWKVLVISLTNIYWELLWYGHCSQGWWYTDEKTDKGPALMEATLQGRRQKDKEITNNQKDK